MAPFTSRVVCLLLHFNLSNGLGNGRLGSDSELYAYQAGHDCDKDERNKLFHNTLLKSHIKGCSDYGTLHIVGRVRPELHGRPRHQHVARRQFSRTSRGDAARMLGLAPGARNNPKVIVTICMQLIDSEQENALPPVSSSK